MITDVKKKYEGSLLMIEGVVGVGADLSEDVIVVYVEDDEVCDLVPKELDGYKVRCVVVGKLGVL